MIYLADLGPRTVRADVLERITSHIASLTIAVAPTMDSYSLPGPDDMTVLGAEVEGLVQYAQRGLPVWDWTTSGMAADAMNAVLHALYMSAAGGTESPSDVIDDVDPVDAIGVVLVAAAARIRIDNDGHVSPRELGALAGVTADYVNKLVRSGEIASEPGRRQRVPAEEATRWLAARGVPGF